MLRDSLRKTRSRRPGFTLIELLIVVLILAILMAVALPLYLSAVADSEKKTCRANMQTIANAVQAAKVSGRKSDYATLLGATSGAPTEPDLQSTPVCPSAGVIRILRETSGSNPTFKIVCTNHCSFE